MIDLDAVRARSAKAVADMKGTLLKYDGHFPLRHSARDVPDLLALIDRMTPVVEAAQLLAQGFRDRLPGGGSAGLCAVVDTVAEYEKETDG